MYIPLQFILPFLLSLVGIAAVILLQSINYFTGKKIDRWTLPVLIVLSILAAVFYTLGNQYPLQYPYPPPV